MTEEEMRIAIAKECGWTHIELSYGDDVTTVGLAPGVSYRTQLPDYFNDLNSCHEMEKALSTLTDAPTYTWRCYAEMLDCITDGSAFHATAAQRAEAFLKTKGLL